MVPKMLVLVVALVVSVSGQQIIRPNRGLVSLLSGGNILRNQLGYRNILGNQLGYRNILGNQLGYRNI
ncbi:Uncharacterised protein g5129 [Pycnogonum litorale]